MKLVITGIIDFIITFAGVPLRPALHKTKCLRSDQRISLMAVSDVGGLSPDCLVNTKLNYMRKLFFVLLLLMVFYSKSQSQPEANLLFNAFKQGNVNGGGNCASIALIKASIGTFGVGNIFTYSKSQLDSSIMVKLRNDSSFKVSYKEIREATKENGFVNKAQSQEGKRIKSYADTCFAIMVKMNEILWEYDSYAEALTALLNGYNTPNVYRLLGVRFREIPTSDLANNTNIVTYNSYHAVYSSLGYYDETKSSRGFSLNSSFNNNRFGIKCSWYGCKPKRAFVIE